MALGFRHAASLRPKDGANATAPQPARRSQLGVYGHGAPNAKWYDITDSKRPVATAISYAHRGERSRAITAALATPRLRHHGGVRRQL